MNGIKKVLKASLNLDLKGLGGAIIGFIIASIFLYFTLGQEIMGNSDISRFDSLGLIFGGMTIVAISVLLAMSQAQSIGDILPIASKLGNKREEIAWGLLLKDIIISIVAFIILKLIVNFIMRVGVNSSALEFNTLREFILNLNINESLIKFILNFLSISVIVSVLAYILKINPVVGGIIGLTIAIAFNSSSLTFDTFTNNLWQSLILFIISQTFRFYVIKKLDIRF